MEQPTSYTLQIDAPQLERLRAIKRATGAPVSELIRRAIDGWLESAQPDNAATAKEVSR